MKLRAKKNKMGLLEKSKTVSVYVHMYVVYAYGWQIAQEILCKVESVDRIVAEFLVVARKY